MYPTKKLSEICEKVETWNPVSLGSETFEYIDISSIDNTRFLLTESKTLTGNEAPSRARKLVKKDDIIFATTRPNLKNITLINSSIQNLTCSTGFCVLRAKDTLLDFKYLFYYIVTDAIQKRIAPMIRGAGYPAISDKDLLSIEIPLPPLPIQHQIVSRLDEAFLNIDESRSLLRANIADVESMRKSILEESLISEDFEIKKIDDISLNIQYGYTGKTKETGKYKLLRITDIQDNLIDWSTVPFVDITDTEAQKYMLNIGDIVFARTGATVGKSCTISDKGVGQVFASYLIRVIVKPGILTSEFLQYFFYSKYYWDQIYTDVVGAAQPNFNGSKLKEIQIPLPPLPIQHQIVAHLDSVWETTDRLKRQYEEQIRDLDSLKQSLLEEAFAGRLIPENEA